MESVIVNHAESNYISNMAQNISKKSYLFPAILALCAIAVWSLLSFSRCDYLIRVAERSLFLDTGLFFKECMQSAGGLLTYAGCFLTQYLYLPKAGALIAVILWCGVALLACRIFHGSEGRYRTAAFIPAAALLTAAMSMGYTIFMVKAQGWFFTQTLGYLLALCGILCFTKCKGAVCKLVFISVWTLAGYPLIGFYALLGTLAMAILSAGHGKSGIICPATAAAFIIAAPIFWSAIYTTGRTADSFFAILPEFPFDWSYASIWAGYLVLVAYTLVSAFLIRAGLVCKHTKPLFRTGVEVGTFVITALCSWLLSFNDANFNAELAMNRAIGQNDWKRVTRIHSETADRFAKSDAKAYEARTAKLQNATGSRRQAIIDEYADKFYAPTRLMVMYKDLALLKAGTSGNAAFHFKDGGADLKSPTVIPTVSRGGKQLYFHYGLLNYCHRWCIEDAVEFGWNVESLKYAIRSSLVAGNWDIAEKYIDILSHSPLHRSWAEGERKYLHAPDLIAASDEYGSIIPMICKADDIDGDKSIIETFLMRYFKNYRTPDATPEFDDAAILWAMRSQDIPAFWTAFSNWIASHPKLDAPVHYQEAAYMYGNLEKTVDISGLPFSSDIAKKYDSFMQYASKHPFSIIEEASYPYGRQFGNTFFYFYYFIRGIDTF